MTRTYEVRTYGCQMNVHDSERLSGLLEDAGYAAAPADEQADVVVFNTCAVRENADNRLYGNLGHLAPVKAKRPGMQIAVGGCLAQKDRDTITKKAPWVDVVFGTHNIGSLPVLLERARIAEEAQVEILESLDVFPSTLPTKRESAYAAWVSISVGCNNTCTFCIVPALRGKEKDRRPGEILAEIEALVAEGVTEVTLLGQNVNTYGVEFGDRLAFGKLLRACGEIEGLERVRFTSPHPSSFTDDVIAAMAETPNVMPQLHMPLQSGSSRLLKEMRRSYRQEKFLGIIERVRAAMPDAAITTDIIVGFPGETEEDFLETMKVVREARFAGAFTFQYSKRPGTPAADLPDQVEKAVVQERYERLVELVNEITWEENKQLIGKRLELMVSEGEGRKDEATHRLSGRAPDNRLVHFTPVVSTGSTAEDLEPVDVRPGDIVYATVTYAAPHHLVADGPVEVRRTRSGDAWESRTAPSRPVSRSACPRSVCPPHCRTPPPVGEDCGSFDAQGASDPPQSTEVEHLLVRALACGQRCPMDLDERLALQSGVVSRRQVLKSGLTKNDIARKVRRREWAVVHQGVYVDHTGPLTWVQRAWAAVLYAWPAALAHESALRVATRANHADDGRPIQVVVAERRRVKSPAGVVVHRCRGLEDRVQWNLSPPRVRFEEAAIDVAARAGSDFDAIATLSKAIQTRRTTAVRMKAALDDRRKLARRPWLGAVLQDIAAGTCSVLEHGYLTKVERPHGLGAARRQTLALVGTGSTYRDVEYDTGLIVELDGRLFHDNTEQRDRDLDRDLVAATTGQQTVRLGWGQVFDRPCVTAERLGRVLGVEPTRCGEDCGISGAAGAADAPRTG